MQLETQLATIALLVALAIRARIDHRIAEVMKERYKIMIHDSAFREYREAHPPTAELPSAAVTHVEQPQQPDQPSGANAVGAV